MIKQILALLVVVILIVGIWAIAGGRPLFRSSGNIHEAVEDAGQEIKSTGRDVADSIRRTVQ